jgi:hypothetical protein
VYKLFLGQQGIEPELRAIEMVTGDQVAIQKSDACALGS